ncbi:MAG: TIGR00374 family protein [Gammaproteobacteria bacterium]|nr:MAG: TIGR00374 family protein [Gammaproteobacteria bacterium]
MERFKRPFFISLIVCLAIYLAAIVFADWNAIASAMRLLSAELWLWVLVLSLVNYVLRFGRWDIYIRHLQPIAKIPLWTHLKIYLSGFALTTTPGKSGELVRSVYLVNHGVAYKSSVSAFFVERLVDLFAVLFLALAGGMFYAQYQWITLVLGVCLFVLLLLLRMDGVRDQLLNASLRSERLSIALNKIGEWLACSSGLLSNRLFLVGASLGVLAWGAEGLGLYLITQELQLNVDPWMAVGIYSIAVLIGALSFVPGGVGGTEAVMSLLLINAGASAPEAIVATLVCRVATLWFAVLVGVFAMVSLEYSPKPLDVFGAKGKTKDESFARRSS